MCDASGSPSVCSPHVLALCVLAGIILIHTLLLIRYYYKIATIFEPPLPRMQSTGLMVAVSVQRSAIAKSNMAKRRAFGNGCDNVIDVSFYADCVLMTLV